MMFLAPSLPFQAGQLWACETSQTTNPPFVMTSKAGFRVYFGANWIRLWHF